MPKPRPDCLVMRFLFVAIFLGVVAAFESSVYLTQEGNRQLWGTLEWDAHHASFTPAAYEPLAPAVYCVSVGLEGPCVVYKRLGSPLNERLVVTVDPKGALYLIGLWSNSLAVTTDTVEAVTRPVSRGAAPLIHSPDPKASAARSAEPVVVEKSWLQRNYLYIVIPLAAVFMLLPADGPAKQTKTE